LGFFIALHPFGKKGDEVIAKTHVAHRCSTLQRSSHERRPFPHPGIATLVRMRSETIESCSNK
jgi:hypothetical protein